MDDAGKKKTPEKIVIGEAKRYIVFQEVTCNIIFDVEMKFPRKDPMVANGAMTEAPLCITYSYFVSTDSVCLPFLRAEFIKPVYNGV